MLRTGAAPSSLASRADSARLAAKAALPRSAISARFRRLVGESPRRYLTRARLAHAATLLQKTDASLAQIAAEIGYSTEFSFAKPFKRAFGVAPGGTAACPTESQGSPSPEPRTASLSRSCLRAHVCAAQRNGQLTVLPIDSGLSSCERLRAAIASERRASNRPHVRGASIVPCK